MKYLIKNILSMILLMTIISCSSGRMNIKGINNKKRKGTLYTLCSLFMISNAVNYNGYQNGLLGGRVPNFDQFGQVNPHAWNIMQDRHNEAREINYEFVNTGHGGYNPTQLEISQAQEITNNFGINRPGGAIPGDLHYCGNNCKIQN